MGFTSRAKSTGGGVSTPSSTTGPCQASSPQVTRNVARPSRTPINRVPSRRATGGSFPAAGKSAAGKSAAGASSNRANRVRSTSRPSSQTPLTSSCCRRLEPVNRSPSGSTRRETTLSPAGRRSAAGGAATAGASAAQAGGASEPPGPRASPSSKPTRQSRQTERHMQAPTHRLAERSTCETPPHSRPALYHRRDEGANWSGPDGNVAGPDAAATTPRQSWSRSAGRIARDRGDGGRLNRPQQISFERIPLPRGEGGRRPGEGSRGRWRKRSPGPRHGNPLFHYRPPRRSCSRLAARITPDWGHEISPGFLESRERRTPCGEIRQSLCLFPAWAPVAARG